jgi:hypothetical protein
VPGDEGGGKTARGAAGNRKAVGIRIERKGWPQRAAVRGDF